MKEINKDTVFKQYKKETNMTFSELFKHSINPLSQTSSLRGKKQSEEAKRERAKLIVYLKAKINDSKYKNVRRFNTAQIRNLVLLIYPKSQWDKFLIDQAVKAIIVKLHHKKQYLRF